MTSWKHISRWVAIPVIAALVLALVLPLAVFNAPTVNAEDGVTVSIDCPAQVGEGITDLMVKVNVTEVTNFDIAQFDVTYDNAVLHVTDVTAGNIGGTVIPIDSWGFIPPGQTPPDTGTIRVIANVPGAPGVTGSGYLAKIHFKVIGSSGTSTDITFSDGLLGDNLGHEITPVTWTDGSVTVTTALDADFSADSGISGHSQEGYAGVTTFTFTDSSSGGTPCGTPPYTYAWNFGDDGTSTEQNPTHQYATAGTYTVTLTVTDCLPGDTQDTETKTGYITVYKPLTASFSVAPTEGEATCTTFNFTSSVTGGTASYTYAWNFGDGTGTSTEASPSYTYPVAPGCDAGYPTYTVSLTVTDGLGTSVGAASQDVKVYKVGDANGNCNVEVTDITYVERDIMGLTSDPPITPGADADCSGSVNVLDVTTIELIIMGG